MDRLDDYVGSCMTRANWLVLSELEDLGLTPSPRRGAGARRVEPSERYTLLCSIARLARWRGGLVPRVGLPVLFLRGRRLRG